MGFVYYGNYATYFEVARVEALRTLGIRYADLEKAGIELPVLSYSVKFFKPAYYDELLRIITCIHEMPSSKISFQYSTYNEEGVLLNEAETTLAFIDTTRSRPVRVPEVILKKLVHFFPPL